MSEDLGGKRERGYFFARPTRARLVVIRTDLDHRRVVGVEVEVVPLHRAQDLLGQGVGRLALDVRRPAGRRAVAGAPRASIARSR